MSFSLLIHFTTHFLPEKVVIELVLLGVSSMKIRLLTGIQAALKWVPQPILGSVLLTSTSGSSNYFGCHICISFKLLLLPTINIFWRLPGTIFIKIHVENSCSATHHLTWPTKCLWDKGNTDGDEVFDFIDIIGGQEELCRWWYPAPSTLKTI